MIVLTNQAQDTHSIINLNSHTSAPEIGSSSASGSSVSEQVLKLEPIALSVQLFYKSHFYYSNSRIKI